MGGQCFVVVEDFLCPGECILIERIIRPVDLHLLPISSSSGLMYHISSKGSAPPIFRHLVAEMHTKPPNFGKRFGSSS